MQELGISMARIENSEKGLEWLKDAIPILEENIRTGQRNIPPVIGIIMPPKFPGQSANLITLTNSKSIKLARTCMTLLNTQIAEEKLKLKKDFFIEIDNEESTD